MPQLAPVATPSAAPAAAPANRRHRLRLRELCDEVLASFRAARERDVITSDDRQHARAVLDGLIPVPARSR